MKLRLVFTCEIGSRHFHLRVSKGNPENPGKERAGGKGHGAHGGIEFHALGHQFGRHTLAFSALWSQCFVPHNQKNMESLQNLMSETSRFVLTQVFQQNTEHLTYAKGDAYLPIMNEGTFVN